MTCLRSFSRFVVVWLTLAGVSAAAIPAGWIALRYDPPTAGQQKGHWILVKAPEDGLSSWWSDEELAKIVANDPSYVKQLETDWNPESHPVADAAEAKLLAAELARYWGGDVPQANYWAHGAMVRRGSTLEAYRWTQDGLGQRTALEQSGKRPRIPAAAHDPDPVDQRYDNQTDVVTYGDRWGDHLLSGTLDHVYRAERNKTRRKHHPNPPPAGEVTQKTKATVKACREASLKAEMGVFENYVRGWGGLTAQSVSFGLPPNCVVDPGPPTPIVNPQKVYTACDGSTHSTQAAANAVQCTTNPPITNPPTTTTPPTTTNPPKPYTACDGTKHVTQAAAKAVQCTHNPPITNPPTTTTPPTTTNPPITNPPTTTTPPTTTNPPTTNPGCTISWLCGNDPDPNDPDLDPDLDPDTDPVTPDPDPDGGGNGGNGGGNGDDGGGDGGGTPPLPPPVTPPSGPDKPVVKFSDCLGDEHDTQAEANAVNCDPEYTACDGSLHDTQDAADAVDCSQKERQRILHDLTCEGSVEGTTGQCDDLIITP